MVPFAWALIGLVAAARAWAWGDVGHEIVATIAQTLLEPRMREQLCTVLPDASQYQVHDPWQSATHCHLASVATWADHVRHKIPWSSQLHFVNAVNDQPPLSCDFGSYGFLSTNNILTAITNYTERIQSTTGDALKEAVRFLVHLMGDLHQPLHLFSEAHGGNRIFVSFEGQSMSLHQVWDSGLVNRRIRAIQNYTQALSNDTLESALRDQPYDPYVRWILSEGLGLGEASADPWWPDWRSWSDCTEHIHGNTFLEFRKHSAVMNNTSTTRSNATEWDMLSVDLANPNVAQGSVPPAPLVCPRTWAEPLHAIGCRYAFAPPVPAVKQSWVKQMAPFLLRIGGEELATPEYLAPVEDNMLVELALARAGVRLAHVLQSVWTH